MSNIYDDLLSLEQMRLDGIEQFAKASFVQNQLNKTLSGVERIVWRIRRQKLQREWHSRLHESRDAVWQEMAKAVGRTVNLFDAATRDARGGDKGRAAQQRKREIGRKADEGKVVRAQARIDGINAAAELWAKGHRTRAVKDQLIFRGATIGDDETVRITKNGLIDYVARCVAVPASTLYDWVKAGHLKNVPPARSQPTK